MKHKIKLILTAISLFALVAGTIHPASASAISSSKSKQPLAPQIASVTEIPSTKKSESGKPYANVVISIEAPASNVTKTLVTANGARSCSIQAPSTYCTIENVLVGKKLTIAAKSKTAKSGYGNKSTKATYTVGNADSVVIASSFKAPSKPPVKGTPSPVAPDSNQSSPGGLVKVGTVTQSNAASFWNSNRLNNASTRELVFDKGAKSARVNAVKKGSSPRKISNSTGKSWTVGGLPLAATGKVFFTFGSSTYVCSGSVVTDDKTDRSIVLTAGHCVYNQATSQFATNWIFIPAFDSKPNGSCTDPTNAFPYGCWTARSLHVHSDFSSQTSFNSISTKSDWAFAVMGPSATGAHLDARVGSFAFSESGFTATNQSAYSFGYPAASPYAGADLIYCNGNTFADTNNSSATWGLACNMTGGSSGGPWMSKFSTSTNSGVLSSVNSYKYSNDSTKMYGPKFDSRTRATLNSAQTAG